MRHQWIQSVVLVVGFAPWAWAQEPLPGELALFTTDELVTTPTRTARPVSESPSAVTVITREQIRRSGLIRIPDLLRVVPGVDVAFSTSNHADIGIRGDNEAVSARTLVLVDGRTVFSNVQGFTPWETIPLVLEDIERIEVVRGPVEALYRSPAFSGVINIITRHPKEINSTEVDQIYGNVNTRYVTALHGHKLNERLAYKISGGWKEWDNFEGNDDQVNKDGIDEAVFNGAVSYQLSDQDELRLSGGLSDGDFDFLLGGFIGITNFKHRTEFTKLDFSHGSFKLQGFWNRQEATVFAPTIQPALQPANIDLDFEDNVFDVEAQHSFQVWDRPRCCGAAASGIKGSIQTCFLPPIPSSQRRPGISSCRTNTSCSNP